MGVMCAFASPDGRVIANTDTDGPAATGADAADEFVALLLVLALYGAPFQAKQMYGFICFFKLLITGERTLGLSKKLPWNVWKSNSEMHLHEGKGTSKGIYKHYQLMGKRYQPLVFSFWILITVMVYENM